MTHEVVDMKDFNEWWDRDIIRSSPFRRGSPKYWAWAAWEAALREHAMSEVQRLGQEMEENVAAIEAEREACAGLRKEVALLGKRSTEYEDGFWDGLSKYEDLIRARGSHD